MPWNEQEIDYLIKNAEHMSVKELCKELNKTEGQVRNKKYDLGLKNNKHKPKISNDEREIIKKWYTENVDNLNLDKLSEILNRSKHLICRTAKEMGLTSNNRKRSDIASTNTKLSLIKYYSTEEGNKSKQKISDSLKLYFKNNSHHKGMLGKKHSNEYCNEISKRMKLWWKVASEEDIRDRMDKMVKTKIKNYNNKYPYKKDTNPYSNCRGGKRDDLNNHYFRSAWEANIARLLNLLNIKWIYEFKRFVFSDVSNAPFSYTPDFYLPEYKIWIEVKGWMNEKSKLSLERFKEQYFTEHNNLIIVGEDVYKNIEFHFSEFIPMWEYKNNIKQ